MGELLMYQQSFRLTWEASEERDVSDGLGICPSKLTERGAEPVAHTSISMRVLSHEVCHLPSLGYEVLRNEDSVSCVHVQCLTSKCPFLSFP